MTYLDMTFSIKTYACKKFFRIKQTEMEFSSYLLAYFDGHQKSKGFNGRVSICSFLFWNCSPNSKHHCSQFLRLFLGWNCPPKIVIHSLKQTWLSYHCFASFSDDWDERPSELCSTIYIEQFIACFSWKIKSGLRQFVWRQFIRQGFLMHSLPDVPNRYERPPNNESKKKCVQRQYIWGLTEKLISHKPA